MRLTLLPAPMGREKHASASDLALLLCLDEEAARPLQARAGGGFSLRAAPHPGGLMLQPWAAGEAAGCGHRPGVP